MWTCKHEIWCKDSTRFQVEYKMTTVVDSKGRIVESKEPFDGGATWAACAECDSKAIWINEE